MSRRLSTDDILKITRELRCVAFSIPSFPYREALDPDRLRLAVSKAEWEDCAKYMMETAMYLSDRPQATVDRIMVNGMELVIDERL